MTNTIESAFGVLKKKIMINKSSSLFLEIV